MTDIAGLFADEVGRRPLIPLGGQGLPVRYDFDQGLPAAESYPLDELAELARRTLAEDAAPALNYVDPRFGYEDMSLGFGGLREILARRTAARQGRTIGRDGVILTQGSTQAIALAVNAFVNPGDLVIVEEVTFGHCLRFLEMAGADIRRVPVDDDGMDIDEVERVLEAAHSEGKRVKLVYCIATFQVPTGAVLSPARRKRLVALAQRHRFLLLEDDVYGELRFAGEDLPTLFGMDDSGLVMQCGSFSKTVAPGLRLGWMVAAPEAIGAMAIMRQDLGVSQWTCRLIGRYVASGAYDRHVARVRELYRHKAAVATGALRAACGTLIRFTPPCGGLFLWAAVDDRVDWQRAQREIRAAGILLRPASRFADEDPRSLIRLAFGHCDDRTITEGLGLLGQILQRCRTDRA